MYSSLLFFGAFATPSAVTLSHNSTARLGHGPGQVMIVSGISSAKEFCLTSTGTSGDPVSLQPCEEAVRAADGRELFSFGEAGELRAAVGDLCVSTGPSASGDGDGSARLTLSSCSSATGRFEIRGDGQLSSGQDDMCVSQAGPSAGLADAALYAAASASSVLHADHGPSMAVDDRSTYWASALDPVLPVDFTIDLGHTAELEHASIEWEYPASSFSVLLSADGVAWKEVYSTDVNSLHSVRVPFGVVPSRKVKVVMRAAHPTYGNVRGKSMLGIRRISLYENRLRTVTAPCSQAGASTDARDKYFIVAAPNTPRASSEAEVPSRDVELASKSLASAVMTLLALEPEVSSCIGQPHAMHSGSSESGLHNAGGSPSTGSDGDAVGVLSTARDAVVRLRSLLL